LTHWPAFYSFIWVVIDMVETYPIMMNMENKVAVVVGGGRVAYRKIVGLLRAGASITIISPVIHGKIKKLLATSQMTWKNKLFEPEDLRNALLVIAATNNKKVNEHVAASTESHQLVNIVDDQEKSDFHVPAKLTRGDLTIAVATDGASPILTTVIRDELAEIYDESYEDYLQFLAVSREQIKHLPLNQDLKRQMLKQITELTYRKSINKQKEFLEKIEATYKI